MYWVYILRSLKDGKHYTGYTSDLKRRLEDHNRGKSISVKSRGPFELVHKEFYIDRKVAIRRERQIKKYKSGAAFKSLVITKFADPIV